MCVLHFTNCSQNNGYEISIAVEMIVAEFFASFRTGTIRVVHGIRNQVTRSWRMDHVALANAWFALLVSHIWLSWHWNPAYSFISTWENQTLHNHISMLPNMLVMLKMAATKLSSHHMLWSPLRSCSCMSSMDILDRSHTIAQVRTYTCFTRKSYTGFYQRLVS